MYAGPHGTKRARLSQHWETVSAVREGLASAPSQMGTAAASGLDKARARGKVANAVRKGVLERGPCEVCGAVKTDAHHDDYSKPLQVRWLCRLHHRQHHAQLQSAVPLSPKDRISWRRMRDAGGEIDEPVIVVKAQPDGTVATIGMWIPAWMVDEQ